jgi:hypothetical protein
MPSNNKKPRRRVYRCPRLLMFDRSDTRRFNENIERLAALVNALERVTQHLGEAAELLLASATRRKKPTPAPRPSPEAPEPAHSIPE